MTNLPVLIVLLGTDNLGESLSSLVSAANLFTAGGSQTSDLLYIGPENNQVLLTAASFGISRLFHLPINIVEIMQKSFLPTLENFLKSKPFRAIFFSNMPLPLEISAHMGAALQTQLITAVDTITVNDGITTVTRKILAGNARQVFNLKDQPVILTINMACFSAPEALSATHFLETIPIANDLSEERIKVISSTVIQQFVALEHSRVIVAGGRGLLSNPNPTPAGIPAGEIEQWKFEQGFNLLKNLAEKLNGSVGVSRALVDAGYAPYELQIGQTGKTVAPEVYIACGISGALQHTMGMRHSKLVIAINKDARAPIFEVAHVGVIGDLYKILPEWVKLRK